MLDLLEIPLRQQGIGFGRLDGTLSQRARDAALADFKTVDKVRRKLCVCVGGGGGQRSCT